MTLRLISNTRASEPGTMTSFSASLGTWTYRVSPGLALVGLKVILFTVRSAFIAPRTFSECEGSRLGGTAMVYNVFSKLICILVMAEGGVYDPTTEKDPLPDTGDDNDDDDDGIDWDADLSNIPFDPEDPDTASTPVGGEMTTLPPERQGVNQAPVTLANMARKEVEFMFPNLSRTELEFRYEKAPKSGGNVIKVKYRTSDKWYTFFTKSKGGDQKTLNTALPKQILKALGESASDQIAALQEQRDRNAAEIQVRQQEREQLDVQVQKLKETQQEMDAIKNQVIQLENDIQALEDKAGTSLDETTIQRLKDEKRDLEAEHQRKREQYKHTQVKAKETLQLQTEINELKLANRDIDRQINELGVKPTKMLDELVHEKAELEKRLAEKRRVLEDENASSSEREAAKHKVEEDEWALERVNENLEREEQKLPLRERVKNIFKKYGWTLQAVALAVGIVLSALALAATNGLKAGTQAIGNGLKAIGQKLGSLLPGLIGSIVSYIFKAAGQVFSFLAEHAWLLILAVVAFFMERLLKRRRR